MNTTHAVTIDSIITQANDQVSTDLDGEVILMSIKQGNYFGFDKILSRIWALIEKPISVADLCHELMEEYDVEKKRCETDILEVINNLYKEDLIITKC